MNENRLSLAVNSLEQDLAKTCIDDRDTLRSIGYAAIHLKYILDVDSPYYSRLNEIVNESFAKRGINLRTKKEAEALLTYE